MSDAPSWPEMIPILLTIATGLICLASGIIIGAWWPW